MTFFKRRAAARKVAGIFAYNLALGKREPPRELGHKITAPRRLLKRRRNWKLAAAFGGGGVGKPGKRLGQAGALLRPKQGS